MIPVTFVAPISYWIWLNVLCTSEDGDESQGRVQRGIPLNSKQQEDRLPNFSRDCLFSTAGNCALHGGISDRCQIARLATHLLSGGR